MTFRWKGKDWTLEFPASLEPDARLPADRWGETCWADSSVRVVDSTKSKVRFETTIHELLHVALGPKAQERRVEQTGAMIADVLWRLGYRRTTRK